MPAWFCCCGAPLLLACVCLRGYAVTTLRVPRAARTFGGPPVPAWISVGLALCRSRVRQCVASKWVCFWANARVFMPPRKWRSSATSPSRLRRGRAFVGGCAPPCLRGGTLTKPGWVGGFEWSAYMSINSVAVVQTWSPPDGGGGLASLLSASPFHTVWFQNEIACVCVCASHPVLLWVVVENCSDIFGAKSVAKIVCVCVYFHVCVCECLLHVCVCRVYAFVYPRLCA